MWTRKTLPLVMVVLALLASSAAFAAEAPAVAPSADQFLATLQAQPGEAGEALPDLNGMQSPIFQHGTNCQTDGVQCRPCTLSNGQAGLKGCTTTKCVYNGVWHNHTVCSSCATNCQI